MNNKDNLQKRLTTVIESGVKVLSTEIETSPAKSHSKPAVNESKFHDFRISALSLLSRIFGNTSSYYESFKAEVTQPTPSRTRRGIGMLEAAKKEITGEWLETTSQAIAKNILTDMLRIADLHCETGNLPAAIIISGAILEKQLRLLAQDSGIKLHNDSMGKAVAKRGLQLSSELYKKKVLDRSANKEINGWLATCEAASKGEAVDTVAYKIQKMISGIQNVIAKPPIRTS